jgi:hypothetical protein
MRRGKFRCSIDSFTLGFSGVSLAQLPQSWRPRRVSQCRLPVSAQCLCCGLHSPVACPMMPTIRDPSAIDRVGGMAMRHVFALICAWVLLMPHGSTAALTHDQNRSLLDLMPGLPEDGSTIVVANEGERSCDEYAAIFFDPDEAQRLLADWGCRDNAFRAFAEAQPSDAGAPGAYLQVGVTRFESANGAAAALPYVVQNLRPAGAHRELPMASAIGDESRQFVAEVEGGIDLTLLVRSGPVLIGISTLLTDGASGFDPVQVAEGIIQRWQTPPPGSGMTVPRWDVAPLLDAVPPHLPGCLRLTTEEPLDFDTLVTRFPGVPDAAARLGESGWRTGAHRSYACDPPPATGINWLDMSVHGFADEASAAAAVPFFSYARTVGTQLVAAPAMRLGGSTAALAGPSENGTEYTLYLSSGRLLFRVSAVSADESPQADVERVMRALFVSALGHRAAVPPRAHNLGAVPQATEAPAPTEGDDRGVPYITTDESTGQIIYIYPDGSMAPAGTATIPAMTTEPPPDGAGDASATTSDSPPLWSVTPSPVATEPSPPPAGHCDSSYPDVCIPPVWEVGDLDCPDVPYGSFRVDGDDPHRFDGPYDGSMPNEPDGIGCEWNAGASSAAGTYAARSWQRTPLGEMFAECAGIADAFEHHTYEELAYDAAEGDLRLREEDDHEAGYGPQGSGNSERLNPDTAQSPALSRMGL